jgi:methanogenic corrinoid protein MtbC1
MPHQGYVINALKEAGIRNTIKVMVGGAPTTEKWAKEIGADGWAPNAVLTVKQAKRLLQVD